MHGSDTAVAVPQEVTLEKLMMSSRCKSGIRFLFMPVQRKVRRAGSFTHHENQHDRFLPSSPCLLLIRMGNVNRYVILVRFALEIAEA